VPPTTKAARVERLQCEGTNAQNDLRLLQSTTVLKAEPLYSHVVTGKNDSEERVTGAKLLIRPPDDVSAEHLTRILQCHSAKVLLGQVDASQFADDPYVLPDSWVDIDVKPQSGNFLVTLRTDNIPDGLSVLHRATAFAETHRSAAP
jgi:hypothetical protein